MKKFWSKPFNRYWLISLIGVLVAWFVNVLLFPYPGKNTANKELK